MKEMKMNRKTRYTRMALRDSLMELMKEKPLAKITIKELCNNADINRTTFYAHYTNQYDLLNKIETETLEWAKEAISNVQGNWQQDISESIKNIANILEYLMDNHTCIQVLLSEKGDLDFQKQLFILICEQCGITPSTSTNKVADTYELSFIFVVNGSIGLIQHWLKTGMLQSPETMARIILDMAAQIH